MSSSTARKYFAFPLFFLILAVLAATAQQNLSLRGLVADPTGAVIPQATVTLSSSSARNFTATSAGDGTYQFSGVPAGVYQLKALASGFAPYMRPNVQISTSPRSLDIKLQIELQQQQVEVSDNGAGLDTSPGSNASATIIKGKDLEALSDDPDDLAAELQALAGPSAGPNGGQIYVDGFTGGQMPPKSSIREIRVNQDPFSAQYDSLGYGRIEILTKPGTEKFHGQVNMNGGASSFNTRWSPITQSPATAQLQQPDYHTTMLMANLGGPINKSASFALSYSRRDIADNAMVNATVLDSNFQPVPFVSYLANPRTRLEVSPRIDYQLSANNTLIARYEYGSNSEVNGGVGGFSLLSSGYNSKNSDHEVRISDTQVFGARVVNETRFQYVRSINAQTPRSTAQSVSVSGAFSGGGSSAGKQNDQQSQYELQNYTSMALGNHAVKFGARLRERNDRNTSYQGFNGTYVFSSLAAYQTTMRDQQKGWSPAQIRADGGGPSQYNIVTGTPTAKVNLFDAGLYAEDAWKARPNLTLTYGLRFETQNQIHDRADFGPRVGVAWAIGKNSSGAPKAIVRGGFGIFYDRFAAGNILQAQRQNGVNQQIVSITNPDTLPAASSALAPLAVAGTSGAVPGRYQIDPNIHASFTTQTGVSIEKQLSKTATLSATYLNARGQDGYLTRNINAPLPGTYNPQDPSSGVRPNGKLENVYQYGSQGRFNQNQLITNMNLRATKGISLFGFYVFSHANADSNGSGSRPSQPYNIEADYGRASYDVHHRLFVGGSTTLPHEFVLSPFVVASSGSPFNITTGTDLNGDFQYTDRPAFATDLTRPSVMTTRYGAFDTAPIAGQTIIPSNYETGPAHFTANLRVAKTFGIGRKLGEAASGSGQGPAMAGPGGDFGGRHGGGGGGFGGPRGGPGGGSPTSSHRYNLNFSVQALNIFNIVNLANPTGVLTSRTFGESNSLAGQIYSSSSAIRRISLQAQFSF